jgi:hypothetical protein
MGAAEVIQPSFEEIKKILGCHKKTKNARLG